MKKCIGMAVGDKSSLTCTGKATEKKLAGAALKSFMKKCEDDASVVCDGDGKSQKLAGAALKSHMTKCVADAVGAK